MIQYFDTHAHYDSSAFESDVRSALIRAKNSGVSKIVNIGTSVERSKKTVELTKEYDFVYGTVGIHPDKAEEGILDENLQEIRELATCKKIVAIGEIGLDRHLEKEIVQEFKEKKSKIFDGFKSSKEVIQEKRRIQEIAFKKQLEISIETGLPVVIHSRNATEETFSILKAFYREFSKEHDRCPGVVHCFSGSTEIAREYIKMGFMVGIGGAVTWKHSKRVLKVVKNIPLESIVLETDAPYQTPEPHRGERNESLYLNFVAEKIAEIKEVDIDTVAGKTYENAEKLYGIKSCILI